MLCKVDDQSKRVAMMQWIARIGAVTADSLAESRGASVASARGRLNAAEHEGLLSRWRPLTGQPALYTATRAGLHVAGVAELELTRVSAANAGHVIACAGAAGALGCRYPDHLVMGERELRLRERQHGAQLASASLGCTRHGDPLLHRPDLVLWPVDEEELPVAVEVELTIKAPRRLFEICRAWARCRCVAGVLYLAAPKVLRPLQRAIEKAGGDQRIVVVGLDALPHVGTVSAGTIESSIAGNA